MFSLLTSVKRLRTVVLCLSLLFVLLTWSVSSPIGASPDDDFHLASAYCGQGDRSNLCTAAAPSEGKRVPTGLINAHKCYSPPEKSAACLNEENVLKDVSLSNYASNATRNLYPKVYYFASSFLASNNLALSALAMRWLNVIVVLFLFSISYFAAPKKLRQSLALSYCLTSVPLGLFLFSSNNPSSWAIAGISTFWINLTLLVESRTIKGLVLASILTSCSAVVALGSRGDSGYFLIASVGIVVLRSWPQIENKNRKYILVFATSLTAAFLAATRTASQTDALFGGLLGGGSASGVGVFQNGLENIVSIPFGVFGFNGSGGTLGYLGWFNTPIPATAAVTLMCLFVATAVFMFCLNDLRHKILSLLIGLLVIVIPMRILVLDKILIPAYVQPRYVLGMLYLLAGVLFAGAISNANFKFPRELQFLLSIGITLAHSLCLHATLRRYTHGFGMSILNLNDKYLWWWQIGPSPLFVWLIGSLAFGVFTHLAIFDFKYINSNK
jgi:hypothetical protein